MCFLFLISINSTRIKSEKLANKFIMKLYLNFNPELPLNYVVPPPPNGGKVKHAKIITPPGTN